MISLPYRLLGGFGALLALMLFCYLYGRHIQGVKDDAIAAQERLGWAQAVQKGQEAAIQAARDNDALKTKLEVQRAQANTALNILLDQPPVRVLLPTGTGCAAGGGQADTANGNQLQTAATERTADPAQAAFERFAKGLEADAAEWSRALNSCAVVIEWAHAKL